MEGNPVLRSSFIIRHYLKSMEFVYAEGPEKLSLHPQKQFQIKQ